tara:strand:- start:228 stop:587 length:360 start_codon:yes stop_codon:yes gene_type:complete
VKDWATIPIRIIQLLLKKVSLKRAFLQNKKAFNPLERPVFIVVMAEGLAAVILHYQCCKFKTMQLSLPTLCFITRLRTKTRITCGDPTLSMLQIQNQATGAPSFFIYSKAQIGLAFIIR